MKIEFADKSYIEIVKSSNPNKILITIAAKSSTNDLLVISNTVEISEIELANLIKI